MILLNDPWYIGAPRKGDPLLDHVALIFPLAGSDGAMGCQIGLWENFVDRSFFTGLHPSPARLSRKRQARRKWPAQRNQTTTLQRKKIWENSYCL